MTYACILGEEINKQVLFLQAPQNIIICIEQNTKNQLTTID